MNQNESSSQNLTQVEKSILESEDPNLKPKEKKSEKKEKTTDYINLLRVYILPLIVVGIFLVVLVLGAFPSLRDVLDGNNERGTLQKELENKQDRLQDLKELANDSTKTSLYLESINLIAPVENTNVTQFQTDIKKIATDNDLEVTSARAGERIVAVSENDEDVSSSESSGSLQLVEVPSQFTLEGGFVDVKSFLTDIYDFDSFIIIEQMDFSRDIDDTDRWTVDLVLTKYQFNEPTQGEVEFYASYLAVPERAQPEEIVIKFLDEQYLDIIVDEE